MITLRLPVPPSTNNLFLNIRRGRAKSKLYRDWLIEADKWLLMQKPVLSVAGPCEIAIRVPTGGRSDLDNNLKAPLDYLVSRGVTGDDKNNQRVSIEASDQVDCCEVTVTPL